MDPEFIGTGFAFPLKPTKSGPPALVSGEEKIRQSIWLILGTAPGERIMRPEFGCGIHDLVFAANTATLHGLLELRVREALVHWEPRIDVLDVGVDAPDDRRNYLAIRISYRVRANNAFHNLVYPFFLTEGPRR